MHIQTFYKASYEILHQKMRTFTETRHQKTPDELWVVEHLPVYTLGQAGDRKHILQPGNIPVIQSDRGGQVTYHGPGQLIIYTLLDIKRKNISARELVTCIETSVITLLKEQYALPAQSQRTAPGVYINGEKICAIGLRIRRGCAYHGLALNINMDLSPFSGIHPCGYSQLKITQLSYLGINTTPERVAPLLTSMLIKNFS